MEGGLESRFLALCNKQIIDILILKNDHKFDQKPLLGLLYILFYKPIIFTNLYLNIVTSIN